MNERIKELYGQSLEEKYQYGGSGSKPGEMYSNYITVLNPEKFAQLIVKECMTTILKESKWYWDKDEFESSSAIQNAARRVKEHFGVEE